MIVEEYKEYNCNIVGIPGHYAVKAHGNGRIMEQGFKTVEEARQWIYDYRPRYPVREFDLERAIRNALAQ